MSSEGSGEQPAAEPHHARRHGRQRRAALSAGPIAGVVVAGGLAFLGWVAMSHQPAQVADGDSHDDHKGTSPVTSRTGGPAHVSSKTDPRPTTAEASGSKKTGEHDDDVDDPTLVTPPSTGTVVPPPATTDPEKPVVKPPSTVNPNPNPGDPAVPPTPVPVPPPDGGKPVLAPQEDTEAEKAAQAKAAEELDALLKSADAGDATARSTVKKLHFVSLRHEGALSDAVSSRVLRLVRARIVASEYMRLVPREKLQELKGSALKLDARELELRTSYTQDYAKGYGRLVGKSRLAPHPKSLKVEVFVEGAAKPAVSFGGTTPNLDKTVESSAAGLGDGEVWEATLKAIEKPILAWPGKVW